MTEIQKYEHSCSCCSWSFCGLLSLCPYMNETIFLLIWWICELLNLPPQPSDVCTVHLGPSGTVLFLHCRVLSSSFFILTGCWEFYVTAYSGHSCPPLTLRLRCLWVPSEETVLSLCDKCSHSQALATNSSRHLWPLVGGRSPWKLRLYCRCC